VRTQGDGGGSGTDAAPGPTARGIRLACLVPCVVTAATGAALAVTVPSRWRTVALLPAGIPLILQLMVVAAAAATFGFRWRGGIVAGVLLPVLAVALIGAAVIVRVHRPPRVRR